MHLNMSQSIKTLFTKALFTSSLVLLAHGIQAQIQRVDPPNWFSGYTTGEVTLLVFSDQPVSNVTSMEPMVEVVDVRSAENYLYTFVTLTIDSTFSGKATLDFLWDDDSHQSFPYPIRPVIKREPVPSLSQKDLMYLITPDRFANGDPGNDSIAGMLEKSPNRADDYGRHGGDIKGIIDHLDHIQSLGVSALWINPLTENNQKAASYHGYAVTDLYNIDPRYGTNQDFITLSDSLHTHDMKMVLDVVYNHFGDQHYLFKNPPAEDWFHIWDEYTQTNYRAPLLLDPYASKEDKKRFSNGWFDKAMPDVNQKNEDVITYLIQYSLWWIEEMKVDAFRLDTYTYPDLDFSMKVIDAVHTEYPGFFIFGETWVHGPQVQSYFERNNPRGHKLGPDGLTDFQLHFAWIDALKNKPDWATGISKVYYTLAGDYLYNHPENLITFLDNHDKERFFGEVNGDMDLFKMGMIMLYTTRGIPCLYYGTEIGMAHTDGHGKIREDFWGGWPEDSVNKFTAEGRSALENEIYDFTVKLGELRKDHPAMYKGKMIQYVPDNGFYVYGRSTGGKTVVVMANRGDKPVEINWDRFWEITGMKSNHESTEYRNLITGKRGDIYEKLVLPVNGTLLLEFK
ncbi:MAG: glycoside hydrolase family 13 protein [Schleiferiaceae bacterium]